MNAITNNVVSDLVSSLCDFSSPITTSSIDEAIEKAMEVEGVEIPDSIFMRLGILRAQVDNAYDTPEAKKEAMAQARSCMRAEGLTPEQKRGRVLFLLRLSNRAAEHRVRLARAELTEQARYLGANPTFFS